jgi:probable F420-dependent oxidoreductase
MQLDIDLGVRDITTVGARAAALEAIGFDGVWTSEGPRDPFLALASAAHATERLTIGTSIAVALGRSPLTTAHAANDLQELSGGRFRLGLGSQVRAHIVRRYSMPWSQPVAQMRDHVAAVRAIWASWSGGGELRHEGSHYRHTLMTPLFSPGPNPHGNPPILLAGVGPRMTALAGEVGDGFLAHPFTSRRFLEEVTLPALDAGGRRPEVVWPILLATGADAEAMARAVQAVRTQLAFYASTEAYRVVLDLHGRGALQPELNGLVRAGNWKDMAALIDDELLDLLAVAAPPDEAGAALAARTAGIAGRVSLYVSAEPGDDVLAEVVTGFRKAQAGG